MISGKQFYHLSSALNEAFPTYQYLQVFLRQEMDLDLANIASPDAMPYVLYQVLMYAESTRRVEELVEAALRNRPKNPELLEIAQELNVVPHTEKLEKVLNQQNVVFDIATFRTKVAEIESRVCRVELGTAPAGTGFLVGPSAVITCFHSVKKLIEGKMPPSDLRLRFDYKLLEDGTTINSGTVHTLASEWLIDSSPYSEVDRLPEPKPRDPSLEELDYAILRTDAIASEDELGNVIIPGYESPRGFIELPSADETHDFESNKVLFVMQHPLGSPLKLTAHTFRSMNGNQTRVTYLNQTEPGSAGAPCFNANWELVALHHSSDPNFEQNAYREGIPIHAIVNLLKKRDKLQEVAPDA